MPCIDCGLTICNGKLHQGVRVIADYLLAMIDQCERVSIDYLATIIEGYQCLGKMESFISPYFLSYLDTNGYPASQV